MKDKLEKLAVGQSGVGPVTSPGATGSPGQVTRPTTRLPMADPLDELLTGWAERKTPPVDQLEGIQRAITNEVARERILATEEGPALGSFLFLHKLAYAGAGAAAMAAVLVVVLVFHGGKPVTNGDASRFALISPEKIKASREIFNEMDRVFGERLRWVAETGSKVSMGVESAAVTAASDAKPAVIRLSVVSRLVGGKAWAQVWESDVLLRGEDAVEVKPDPAKANGMAFWVYPLADGKIAVDANISLTAPVGLCSRVSDVVESGKPSEVMSLRSGDREYRVYQTVQML